MAVRAKLGFGSFVTGTLDSQKAPPIGGSNTVS